MQPLCRNRLFVAKCVFFSIGFGFVHAQNVDANGNAIDKVEIEIESMVFLGNSGVSFAANNLKTVDGGPLQVDQEGKIAIAIPDMQLGDLARFRLNAKHPDFAQFNDWVTIDAKQWNKVTLWYSEPARAEVRSQVCPSESRWLNVEDSILPALFEFPSSLTEATIGMRATQSATVRFVYDDGTPVANAKFQAQRNQRFFHSMWDSRDFRSTRSTAEELLAARKGDIYQPSASGTKTGQTDANGVAKVDGIPGSKFMIRLEGMRIDNGRLWKSINLDVPQDSPITVSAIPN